MKIILYSRPDGGVLEKIEHLIFPSEIDEIFFGYMPADGNNPKNDEFLKGWQDLAQRHNAKFVYIDNSKKPTKELVKEIVAINSLAIMGGNVFTLLHHLRKSGLDKIIQNKTRSVEFVISGFSAGAIVLTPDVRIASLKWNFGSDKNTVKLKDTRGLGLVDFEILPHYDDKDAAGLKNYSRRYNVEAKPLRDDEFLVMDA